jgi:hypothetical protein
MPEVLDVQLVRGNCFGPAGKMPWVVKAALIQETLDQTSGWKDPKSLAHTIARAISAKPINKILEQIAQKANSRNPIDSVDLPTTIPLTFPNSNQAKVDVVICVSPTLIEVHPVYKKKKTSAKKKTASA